MRKQLLVVVDDWEALEVYEGHFAPHFEVHGAPMASEGLRLAQTQPFDRIFVDLTFEDMHGGEFCDVIRANPGLRLTPITLILNQGEATYAMVGIFPLPGDRVFHRPYDLQEMISSLR